MVLVVSYVPTVLKEFKQSITHVLGKRSNYQEGRVVMPQTGSTLPYFAHVSVAELDCLHQRSWSFMFND